MVLANRYFKGIGSTQTSIFRPIHCVTLCITARNHCAMFVFFSFLWSLSSHCPGPLHFHISLWNLQIALVTDFARVIIITSVLFRRSRAEYWLCWYKRYVTKVFCIYRKLLRNRSQRTLSFTLWLQTWTYRNGMCIIMDFREGNFNEKLYFHKEKDWLDAVVTAKNLAYLFLMQVLQINWFSMVKLREARSKRDICLFITTHIQQFEEK